MSLSSPHWQAVLCHQRLLGSLLRTCKSPCFSYCSFALALCCPEVFLAKQAAVSPEAACANPLCLHTASGPAWEPQVAPRGWASAVCSGSSVDTGGLPGSKVWGLTEPPR